MGFVNVITKFPTMTMKLISSIFSSGSITKFMAADVGFAGFMSDVLNFLVHIFYFGCKWMLYLIDILYSFIRQLSGLEMSFDSLESMVSKESDFVFNLLFSATDLITPIIRNLIGITVALIIFFAILAVIKTQFNSLRSKTPADIKGVFRDVIKAFLLLFITPMIAIGGIIASNLILQTLYNATNVTNSNSLSTQIFSVSAKSANAYRIYAQEGMKIPVTFDMTQQKEIVDYYKNHGITDKFMEYNESEANIIYMNYRMFQDASFVKYDLLNDITGTTTSEQRAKEYYLTYDRSTEAFEDIKNGKETVNSYKKFTSYKPEYYVMADVMEFCIESGTTAYFKTIEQVLDSVVETGDVTLFNNIRNLFGIEFLDQNLKYCRPGYLTDDDIDENLEYICVGQNSYWDIFKGSTWQVIRFSSWYYDANDESEPYKKMQIEYNHVRGATDEVKGAKFIVSVEQETEVEEQVIEFVDEIAVTRTEKVTKEYFYPLTVGLASGNQYGFESDFIQTGQIIAAKGVFSKDKYFYPVPTAMRIGADGYEVQFYRHDLKTVSIGDSSELIEGAVKSEPQDSNGFLDFFRKIAALVNPNYDFNIDPNQVVVSYTYEETLVNKLSAGKLSISYMFEDDVSNVLGGVLSVVPATISAVKNTKSVEMIGIHGLKLNNVFVPNKMNMVVLVVGSLTLLKIIFAAVFSLINRGYELFLTIIVYPTACATIPIMDKQDGYKMWMQTYTQRLFATYGLILGLNFVIMLFPVISEIEIFTAGEIALSTPLMRLRGIFGNLISLEFLADFLNLVMVIVFELTAFGLLETAPQMIQNVVGGSALSGTNPIETLGKVIKTVTGIAQTIWGAGSGIVKTVIALFDDKKRAEMVEKVKRKALEFVPGSEVVESAKDFKNLQNKKKAQKEAMETLKDSLEGAMPTDDPNKSPEENKKARDKHTDEVSKNFQAVLDAQSAYNQALADPRKNRYAEDDKKRNNELSGLNEDGSSRTDEVEDGDADEGADLSWKTKKELKKEKKKAKQVLRVLEKKQKKGGVLTAEEQKALEAHQRILTNVENAQNKQKNAGKEYEANKTRLDELKKLQTLGTISTAQLVEMKDLQQKVDDYEHRDEKNKARRQVVEGERKKREVAKKEEEKKNERLKKYKRAFGRMDKGSVKIQQQYWQEYAESVDSLQSQLKLAGYTGQNLEDMSDEDLKKALEDKTIPKEQQELLQKYAKLRTEKNQMIQLTEQHFAAQEQRNVTAKTHKNRRRMGTKGGKKMDRKMQGTAQTEDQELIEIQTKIDAMQGNVNGSNLAEYQKLLRRRQELQSKKKFREQWHDQHANLTPEQLKEKREEQKRIDGWEKEAIRALGASAKRSAIESYIARKKKEYEEKQNKKKKKK